MGLLYQKRKDLEKPLEYYLEEYEMEKFCLPFDHPHLSLDLNKIVLTYKKKNEMDKALQFCQKKFCEEKSLFGDNHIHIAQTLISLAKVIEEDHRKEALKYSKEDLSNLKK
jgi:hypothetical protein